MPAGCQPAVCTQLAAARHHGRGCDRAKRLARCPCGRQLAPRDHAQCAADEECGKRQHNQCRLSPQVVNPRVRPQLPPDIFAEDAGEPPAAPKPPSGAPELAAAAGSGAGAAPDASGAGRRGRPAAAWPEDLTPALAAFLAANPGTRAVAKATQVRNGSLHPHSAADKKDCAAGRSI